MKAKYVVILLLVIILGYIIHLLIRVEDARKAREMPVAEQETETEEPFEFMSRQELEKIYPRVSYYAMASDDYFKVLEPAIAGGDQNNIWETLYLKGVNIGAAMPGYFPVEFSLGFADYLKWFRMIGDMNSNVIRVYTLLPPEFYDAFAYYNLNNQNKKLYLIQGIWAEEPEDRDYFNSGFMKTYQKEIRKSIDIINGNAYIKPKVGHASGVYVSDVSKYVIGYLLGREWEPKSVLYTNNANKTVQYTGNFITINNGTAMEVWLARMMDYAIQYETQKYQVQHPVSFINWLPLDPMFHNCEFIESDKIREYDNDLVSVDFLKYNSTDLFVPGMYAAYHVYPYYPDFIFMEKKYSNDTNLEGKVDNFLGYLHDLKKHVGSLPLLIAEYGLPSCRGISHYNPQGFNQGGYSETEQAKLSAVLTHDIYNSKCAGGLFFEWIDEWFKHNWLVMDFEQPAERRKLWHNMENPEQNFGILAVEARTKTIDGKLNDWKNVPELSGKPFILADADPAYFYLSAYLPGFDPAKNNFYVAFDTYDKKLGDHKLPFLNKDLANGIEFLLSVRSLSDARLLVDEPYSVYTDIIKNIIPVYASKYNNNGKFVDQVLIANREKETIMGEKIDSICFNRSILQFGNSSRPGTSNADWYWNNTAKIMEFRFSWPMLNVSDPSSRSVLHDIAGTGDIEYTETPGFNIFYYVTDKTGKLDDDKAIQKPYFYTWDKWEKPEFSERLKPIYYTLQSLYDTLGITIADMEEPKAVPEKFSICNFYENKAGAISITFDDADYNQYVYALPVLGKYNIKANFGIVNSWLSETPSLIAEEGSFTVKRLGLPQVEDIIFEGHEISFHGNYHMSYNDRSQEEITKDFIASKKELEKKLNTRISVIHYPFSNATEKIVQAARNAGFIFGRTGEENKGKQGNTDFMKLSSIVFLNSFTPTITELDSIIDRRANSWTLLLYHHLFPLVSKEYKLYEAHNVVNSYNVTPNDFVKQIRLIRNSDYWISTISNVGKYIRERESSTLRSSTHKNAIFLRVENNLDAEVYNHPLTIQYQTNYKKFRITNCTADGIYNAKDRMLYFTVMPNQDVTIEILDK